MIFRKNKMSEYKPTYLLILFRHKTETLYEYKQTGNEKRTRIYLLRLTG